MARKDDDNEKMEMEIQRNGEKEREQERIEVGRDNCERTSERNVKFRY